MVLVFRIMSCTSGRSDTTRPYHDVIAWGRHDVATATPKAHPASCLRKSSGRQLTVGAVDVTLRDGVGTLLPPKTRSRVHWKGGCPRSPLVGVFRRDQTVRLDQVFPFCWRVHALADLDLIVGTAS